MSYSISEKFNERMLFYLASFLKNRWIYTNLHNLLTPLNFHLIFYSQIVIRHFFLKYTNFNRLDDPFDFKVFCLTN